MPKGITRPTKLRILEAEPNKDRINQNEPKPRPGIPDCPDHLTETAKVEWKRISSELCRVGLLTNIDMAALAGYCQAWANWVQAEKILARSGPIIKTPNGTFVQSPALNIAYRAMEQIRKFANEFGMTPASRSKVHVFTNEFEDDDLLS